MKHLTHFSLKKFNTFGLEVFADEFIEFGAAGELSEIIQSGFPFQQKRLAIGRGSNLLFLHDFHGTVIHSGIQHIEIFSKENDFIILEAGSGVIWDDLVNFAVKNNWWGIENLSLIPGETGAAALQNIGAYGTEISDVVHQVFAIDINTGNQRIFSQQECAYAYRQSIFKNELKDQFIITAVQLKLWLNPRPVLNYQHLETEILKNGGITPENIRKTIIQIRESKLPNPAILGNAGSFFMNPVVNHSFFLTIQEKYPQMPHYVVNENEVKIPAGWLIEQCGWKGKKHGNAGVHDKQALVLVNYGNATGTEIMNLATLIQEDVFRKFGIRIQPEVNYI